MEKDISCQWKGERAGKTILISDDIDLTVRDIEKAKNGYYIIIMGAIHQGEIIITLNVYMLNTRSASYMKQL